MPNVVEHPDHLARLRAMADPAPGRVLYLLSSLCLCDELAEGPRGTAELAEAVGVQPLQLGRVLRVAAGLDLLDVTDDGRWALAPAGELLRSDHPTTLRSELADNDLFAAWTEVLHSVRTGEPSYDKVFGKKLFERLWESPVERQAFHAHMYDRARIVYGPLIGMDVWPERGVVVDVGGGGGGLLAQLLTSRPGLRGVLHDFESVLDESPLRADPALCDRVRFCPGDMFSSPPPGGDVHVLGSVLHDFPDELAASALRACHEAMADGGRLLILERVLPSAGYHPAMCNDLLMMVAVGGRERTHADWTELLAGNGFALTDVRYAEGTELAVLSCERTAGS